MPATITAAARTPWVLRHGSLAGCRPEELAATAIASAADQRGLHPADVALVLLACDTIVGAQALNLGRRTTRLLGWETVPAVAIDGQGVGDMVAIDLAARRGGVTVVAAVDVTSTVPPGAGLIRDFGRPNLDEPESLWLEQLARAAGLDRDRLDRAAANHVHAGMAPSAAIAPVRLKSRDIEVDAGAPLDGEATKLEPLNTSDGLLTAAHTATLADGAAAVIVEAESAPRCRPVVMHAVTADAPGTEIQRLEEMITGPTAVADSSLVVHELLEITEPVPIPSVLALGSVPSADGLRMLVDAFHGVATSCTVLRRGQAGQIAAVTLAAQEPLPLP